MANIIILSNDKDGHTILLNKETKKTFSIETKYANNFINALNGDR